MALPDRGRGPRFVQEDAAARILGLPISNFRHWVKIGRLPGPVADVQLYDLNALHIACDRISGIGAPQNALDAWMEKKGRGDDMRAAQGRPLDDEAPG